MKKMGGVRMKTGQGFALAMSLSTVVAGCGGAGAAGRGPDFPSQASLNELASRPTTPERDSGRKTLPVDDWQPAESSEPTNEAEQLAKAAASAKGQALPMNAELGCAAREIARFYAAHGAFPDQQLQAYMAGVCGATEPNFGIMVWSTPNDTLADATRQKQWHDAIKKQLGEWLPAGSKQLGAAELSDGKTSVFAATAGSSDVVWEERSVVANADGEVRLSGSLRTPAAFIYGLSNVGSYGVRDCRTDPRVAPPRFRITCQLDAADQAAWVDLQALPPGRVLARGIARVLIRREGAALAFTAATKNGTPESVTSPADFSKRMLSLVNETRRAGRLPELKLATRESETSQRLARHYFEGHSDADLGDRIALGLLAGWDISSTIRTGNFYSEMLSGSLDPKRWLGFMLEQPTARRVLLDPQARAIAIGPDVRPQSLSVGALVSTYAFYDSDDHGADVERFIARLNERRQGLGLGPVKLAPAPEVTRAVQSVRTKHDPEAALQTALEQVVARAQHGVEGYYIEATDLDHVDLPEALLRPTVTLAVSAAHHRYPEAAWGTLTLLVVLLDSSGAQKTAQAVTTSRVH